MLSRKEVSSRELTEMLLARIDAANPAVNGGREPSSRVCGSRDPDGNLIDLLSGGLAEVGRRSAGHGMSVGDSGTHWTGYCVREVIVPTSKRRWQ